MNYSFLAIRRDTLRMHKMFNNPGLAKDGNALIFSWKIASCSFCLFLKNIYCSLTECYIVINFALLQCNVRFGILVNTLSFKS